MRIVSLLPSATALARFERRPEVLCLNPQDLVDVWRDILWVGEESCRGPQAEALLEKIGARLGELQQQLPPSADRPRVAFLEWLQPFYVGGHWVPEMIQVAGGGGAMGKGRPPSFHVSFSKILEGEPANPLFLPGGYSPPQTRAGYASRGFTQQRHA